MDGVQLAAGGASALATGAFWMWTRLGATRLDRSQVGALYRGRRQAAGVSFGACAILALASMAVPLPAVALGAASGFAAVLGCLLDPLREGILHHRRARALGLAALMGGGALFGVLLPADGELGGMLPGLAAVLAFHLHQRRSVRMAAEAWDEVAALKERQLSLAAAAHTARVAGHTHKSVDDAPKAG